MTNNKEKAVKVRKYTTAEVEHVKNNPGLTAAKLAKDLGRTIDGVRYLRSRLGVRSEFYPYWSEKSRDEVIASFKAGSSVNDIAKDIGRSHWSVRRMLMRKGLYHAKERKRWTKEEDAFLYHNSGRRTTRWVAEKLKRSQDSVESRCRLLGVVWNNGKVTKAAIARLIGVVSSTVCTHCKKLGIKDLTDNVDIACMVAQSILDNSRSSNRCNPSFKHLEKVARGEFELEDLFSGLKEESKTSPPPHGEAKGI